MKKSSPYLANSLLSTGFQRNIEKERVEYFNESVGTLSDKLNSFSRFMSRQNFAKFVCYYELFKMTYEVLGSILECGVYFGNGLMAYANLAIALEPYNYQCKIIGFDTFIGNLEESKKDMSKRYLKLKKGDYCAKSYNDLERLITIYDKDRPLNHIPKVELIKGDICDTAKKYIDSNPSLTVRILHLSMNLYKPTKEVLDVFLPRVSQGGIVAIEGLNYASLGASQALLETIGDLRKIRLSTFDFFPSMTYFQVK